MLSTPSLPRPLARVGFVAALTALASLGSGAEARTQAGPVLSCVTAKSLARLPARPVWFPAPQPEQLRPAVNVSAPPKFVRGVKWDWGDRYFWLARLPKGANLGDPKAKVVAALQFPNLGRTIRILRLGDGRLFAQWPTAKRYPDTTVVVAKNQTTTEVGFFLASLKKVRWPARCP
jgi:hypothetical protein